MIYNFITCMDRIQKYKGITSMKATRGRKWIVDWINSFVFILF